MKDVQCYELFGGIALTIRHFHFHHWFGYSKGFYFLGQGTLYELFGGIALNNQAFSSLVWV